MRYVTNTCPACGGKFEFEAKAVGREWTCPHCNQPLTLKKPRFLNWRDAGKGVWALLGLLLALVALAAGKVLVRELSSRFGSNGLVLLGFLAATLIAGFFFMKRGSGKP